MKPAIPVTTQTLGDDIRCSRTRRYDAEITSSQSREYPLSRIRIVVRGSTPARSYAPLVRHFFAETKASSIPAALDLIGRISVTATAR